MSLKMYHPEIDSIAEALDATVFNQVWAPRGWLLLDPAEAYASDLLGHPVKDVEALTVDELRGLVASRGLEYPDAKAKKADALKTYRDAFQPERDSIAAHPDADTAVFRPAEDPADAPAPARKPRKTAAKKAAAKTAVAPPETGSPAASDPQTSPPAASTSTTDTKES